MYDRVPKNKEIVNIIQKMIKFKRLNSTTQFQLVENATKIEKGGRSLKIVRVSPLDNREEFSITFDLNSKEMSIYLEKSEKIDIN
jgi:hypothetical protein